MPSSRFTFSWPRVIAALAALLLLIQVVPYGHAHQNPPVVEEPAWDSPATRALAARACFDCHSNETVWPSYASVAPVSWLIQHDVEEGREHFNVSEWNRPQRDAREAAEHVRDGSMPVIQYLPMHPEARLTDEEREALAQGLERTLGTEEGERGAR